MSGDYGRLNSIIAMPHYTLEGGLKKASLLGEDARHYPLMRGMADVPVKGDPVLLCTFGSDNYYLGPLNIGNDVNWNNDILYNHDLSDKRIFFDNNISKIVNHALGSIKETKIFNIENLFTHAFNESVTKREDQNFYINIINSLPRIILEILSIVVLLSIFIFLVFQDKSVTEILPFIALVTLSIIRLIPVFTNMTVQINTLKFYEVSKKIVLEEFKFFDKKHKQSNYHMISDDF